MNARKSIDASLDKLAKKINRGELDNLVLDMMRSTVEEVNNRGVKEQLIYLYNCGLTAKSVAEYIIKNRSIEHRTEHRSKPYLEN